MEPDSACRRCAERYVAEKIHCRKIQGARAEKPAGGGYLPRATT